MLNILFFRKKLKKKIYLEKNTFIIIQNIRLHVPLFAIDQIISFIPIKAFQ